MGITPEAGRERLNRVVAIFGGLFILAIRLSSPTGPENLNPTF